MSTIGMRYTMTRKCRKSINLLIVILASLIIAIMIFVLHGCSSSSNITTIKITRGVAEVTPQQELSNTYHWRTIVLRENEVAPIVEDFKKILTDRYNHWGNLDFSYLIKNVEEIVTYIKNHDNIIEETDAEGTFLKINLLENAFTKMNELRDIAEEIDKEYEEYVKSHVEFNPPHA